MINFATLQGLSIPEGVVTQITDASGRVIWAAQNSKPVVLQVAKVTSNTYAGETTYNNEQFILLDIYPKTNGTVKVTYGGLTKTITDTSGVAEPNAQQVFFGTFNGVSDSVTTPSSGELTIKGDCYAFGCAEYQNSSKTTDLPCCGCITNVTEWGETTSIPAHAFKSCNGIVSFVVPEGITDLGADAFSKCDNMVTITLPSTLKTIGKSAVWKPLNTGCTYTVKILATTPPAYTGAENSVIVQQTGSSACTNIVVPKGCGNAYKAAFGWSQHSSIITEAS